MNSVATRLMAFGRAGPVTSRQGQLAATKVARSVQLSLNFGKDDEYGQLADSMLQSSLFAPLKQGDRKMLAPGEKFILMREGWLDVTLVGGAPSGQKGPLGNEGQHVSGLFDTADQDVLMGLLYLTRGLLGAPVALQPYAFLRSIGRKGDGVNDAAWLIESLTRMAETRVDISAGNKTYIGGDMLHYTGRIISSIAYRESESTIFVALDPQLAALFIKGNLTQILWAERMALRGNSLAVWLSSFFAPQLQKKGTDGQLMPLRWKLDVLQRITRRVSPPRKFREQVEGAAEKLRGQGWQLAIEGTDLVVYLKPSTVSQNIARLKHQLNTDAPLELLKKRRGRPPKAAKPH